MYASLPSFIRVCQAFDLYHVVFYFISRRVLFSASGMLWLMYLTM